MPPSDIENPDPGNEIRYLLRKRADLYDKLDQIYDSFNARSIHFGRLRIRATVWPNTIAVVFATWHLLAGLAGILITILWRDNKELGVALIVGSLFGFGQLPIAVLGAVDGP